MDAFKRIACLLKGHAWRHSWGIFINGKTYPALDVRVCDRCGDKRTDLFNGGL